MVADVQLCGTCEEPEHNRTAQTVELKEALSGSTTFLYEFFPGKISVLFGVIATCIVLLLALRLLFLSSVGRKQVGKQPVVENGTSNRKDMDYNRLLKQIRSSCSFISRDVETILDAPLLPDQSPSLHRYNLRCRRSKNRTCCCNEK